MTENTSMQFFDITGKAKSLLLPEPAVVWVRLLMKGLSSAGAKVMLAGCKHDMLAALTAAVTQARGTAAYVVGQPDNVTDLTDRECLPNRRDES